MLTVVSPAKKLDWSDPAVEATTEPAFQTDAVYLAGQAAQLDAAGLRKLMSISAALAELNVARFQSFQPHTPTDARPAAWAFAGDTYQGLEIRTLEADAVHWADGHLRILSGLYGLLRPRDLIQPYRLEMGSRLATGAGKTLYAYWGDRIARALNAQAQEVGARALLNCASQEYFGAVDLAALTLPVITPVFLEEKNGTASVVSFYAKRARGAMARFVQEHRLSDPADLAAFEVGGYVYQPAQSSLERPVFQRPAVNAKAA